MIAMLLVGALAAAAPGPAPELRGDAEVRKQAEERKLDLFAVPLITYNADEGLGFGAAAAAIARAEDGGHALALSAQAFLTTGGVHSHFLRFDRPYFLGRLRLEGRGEYRRERFAPFFGAGNTASPGVVSASRSPFFTYDRRSYGGWLRVRESGRSRLPRPYAGLGLKQTRVRAAEDSLLDRVSPQGLEGGPVGQLLLGLVRDTRDEETDPRSGGAQELSLRLAGPATGSRYSFLQLSANVRQFLPLHRRWVLAGRLAGDWLAGDVPFYELPTFGGLSPLEGVGGNNSVRGLDRHRYVGNAKLLANLELRVRLWEPMLFGEPTRFGAVAFGDVGRAWANGVPDGPFWHMHPAAGLGLRLVRGPGAVRLDYGRSRGRRALYLMFGQLF